MKKIITTVLLICVSVVSALAVTVNEAVGVFKGDLNIGGDPYPNKEVYILPGIEENTITFVLPDFKFGAASLGDIVLMNIPIDANGQLSLNDATLYIKAISERAEIDVINGLEDGGDIYNSVITESDAMVLLSIAAPSLPEPIFVLFTGSKETGKNYEITNGGFEGNWSGGEPTKWHSFPSATGFLASMAGGEDQFKQSNETRPGSTGSHSALIASNLIAGVKANGNCTNGQINAGSTTADSPADNYNFSDPANNGFNTAFVGQPDSLVFWAKYIPADKKPSNSVNKARAHAVITTNARYQDPEAKDYSSVKIAEATINYSATSSMGWQRFAIPFEYTAVDPSQAAYMLITFTTNMTPGGGSTYSTGGFFDKTYYYDNIYLDDAEMIYNHSLASLTKDGTPVTFTNNQATSSDTYSDSDYDFVATTDGKAAKSFIGYDPEKSQVHVYVVADNYSQAGTYSLYTLQMVKPVYNTEYAYSATTCDNEPYSDELFSGLTENGVYNTTIPNKQGGDSLITLTLTVYPTYSASEQATIAMDQTYSWQGTEYKDLVPGTYKDTVALKTIHGCDSVYTLELTVEPIDYSFSEELTVCQNEEITWREKTLPTNEAGVTVFNDSLLSIYNTDSVFTLTLTVLPTYRQEDSKTITEGDSEIWEGIDLSVIPAGDSTLLAEYKAVNGCDSVMVLHLTVETKTGTGLFDSNDEKSVAKKVLHNGRIYIIRKDESIYDLLGNKIQ